MSKTCLMQKSVYIIIGGLYRGDLVTSPVLSEVRMYSSSLVNCSAVTLLETVLYVLHKC